jgi:hypothetical protein
MKAIVRFFIVTVFMLVGASAANAASLYIDPAYSNLYRGDAVKLAVRLDVDEAVEECVNAVDAVITYTDNIAPVDISLGDSIFNVWVEAPVINREKRTITFAGGLPNGYCGRVPGDPRLTNTIVELVFRSPGFAVGSDSTSNEAVVEFTQDTAAYLNDGFGTKIVPAVYPARLQLADSAGPTIQDPWRIEIIEDDRPPQDFSVSLQRDTKAFGGKYFIVFNTTDKETGIDHYEVLEEPLTELGDFSWGGADVPWITTRSPYTLEDQSLNSTIYVKAIDKAGNEYVAKLIPGEDARGIPTGYYFIGAGLLIILLMILAIAFTGWKTYRKRAKRNPDETAKLELDKNNHDA